MAVRDATGPLAYRGLVWNFAERDLRARFKGTALGWAWSLVVPLATLLTYTVVFAVIFRAAPPDFGSGRKGNFTVWLLAGLVPWTMFATSINTAMPTLLATGPLLKKIFFPSYAPILGSVIAVLIQSAIELSILLVVLVVLGNVAWTWLLVVPWAVSFVVFIAAMSHILSILNVYFRDLVHIIGVTLQLLFYISPIIYRIQIIPEEWHGLPLRLVISANPMTQFIQVFRELVYGLNLPPAHAWLYCFGSSAVAAGLAILVHRTRGLDLGEEL
ncbi:hypothetical protein GCM10027517_24040 [Phycicoccus ginsengisoli]